MENKTWENCGESHFTNSVVTDFFGDEKNAGHKPQSIFNQLSIHSFGHLSANALLHHLPQNNNNYYEVIRTARRYIHENFSRKISIDEIARHCCMSQYHFSRIFKIYASISPHQYLLQLRLRHAEKLTTYTDLPITDICFISGFSSLDYFSAAFAKKYKVSPKKFRLLKQAELQQ